MASEPGSPARLPFGDADAALSAFESLPAALFVHEGPEHVFVAVNARARELLRDRPVLGKPFRLGVPDLRGQRMLELMDEVYRTGEPREGREWRLLFHEPGAEPGAELRERVVDFTLVPHHYPDGTLRGVLGWALDVTEDVAARARVGRRAEVAQELVVTLQSSLLPASLPVLPGVQLAAHYLVAAGEQAAGGDWFDAVPLPDGRLALVAGDVVGHGARASAVMGQLRAVLTAFLREGSDPAEALARLDRYAAHTPGALAATVGVVVLDPATGELAYAGAGHPRPLVLTSSGQTRYLPAGPGVPLGTVGPPVEARAAELEPGDIVLLYTDGLVERPGRGMAEGLEELRVYAADALAHGVPEPAGMTIDRVCRISMERMTRQGYHDDVSLIGAQWTGERPKPFRAELPASPAVLAGLRQELGLWLDTLGVTDGDVHAVQLAVGEAAANAVEHAYPADRDEPGLLDVEVYHDVGGRVCLTVRDAGAWRPPPSDPSARGRGLVMIRGCMDTVEVETGPDGTALLMDRYLGRAPVFGTDTRSRPTTRPGRHAASELELRLEHSSPPVLTAIGPIDVASADRLRTELQLATRGGAFPLDLDLSAATHLASAGVQALHEFAEQMAADGHRLRLIAPPRSLAREVLELAGLDRLVADRPGPSWGV